MNQLSMNLSKFLPLLSLLIVLGSSLSASSYPAAALMISTNKGRVRNAPAANKADSAATAVATKVSIKYCKEGAKPAALQIYGDLDNYMPSGGVSKSQFWSLVKRRIPPSILLALYIGEGQNDESVTGPLTKFGLETSLQYSTNPFVLDATKYLLRQLASLDQSPQLSHRLGHLNGIMSATDLSYLEAMQKKSILRAQACS